MHYKYLILYLCLLGNALLASEPKKASQLTKDNTILAFDLDDTLIQYSPWHQAKIGWNVGPRNIPLLLKLKKLRKKDKTINFGRSHFQDKQGNAVPGGASLQMAAIASQNPNLQPIIPTILKTTWENTRFKPGAQTLLNYLKTDDNKNYPIWYATNKDRTSYNSVTKALDENYPKPIQFGYIPDKIFVVQPSKVYLQQNLEEPKSADSKELQEYKALIESIRDSKKSSTIIHSKESKPNAAYYKKMVAEADGKKVIFFDDYEENAKQAGETTNNDIMGVHVKSIADIVNALEKLGILNRSTDAPLFHKLKRDGVFGYTQRFMSYLPRWSSTPAPAPRSPLSVQ